MHPRVAPVQVAVEMEAPGSRGEAICLLLEKALKNQGPWDWLCCGRGIIHICTAMHDVLKIVEDLPKHFKKHGEKPELVILHQYVGVCWSDTLVFLGLEFGLQ